MNLDQRMTINVLIEKLSDIQDSIQSLQNREDGEPELDDLYLTDADEMIRLAKNSLNNLL